MKFYLVSIFLILNFQLSNGLIDFLDNDLAKGNPNILKKITDTYWGQCIYPPPPLPPPNFENF